MNDEETEDVDNLPYGCERWGPCVLDKLHDGPCRDRDGQERRASSLMRERWGKG